MKFVLQNNIVIPESLSNTQQQPASISQIPSWSTPPMDPSFSFSIELQSILQGKQLLLDELLYPIELIQSHYEHGYLAYRKGIVNENGKPKFVRCGNQDSAMFASFFCARCDRDCTYCRKCIMMGRVSECTPLLNWTGPKTSTTGNGHNLNWNGTLSDGQANAALSVVEAIDKNEERIVWAVCGAGKTELLFPGIEKALQQNKSVCIAAPRTDVVLELSPRLKAVFPSTEVIALYGGSDDRKKTAALTIATTHQLLRYYQAFDVLIIDEVDAFPYSIDDMLQYAVHQAKKDISATIYLTATPSKTFQQRIKQKKLTAAIIPSRFHGRPLPVPTFRWCGNWRKLLLKQKLPKRVEAWVDHHIIAKKQAFFFVPSIQALEIVVKLLKKKDKRIEGVHAEDLDRKEKVLAFRQGMIPIMVTTTILERGVTVPNTDVAVLGADDRIFTESALVQISGRVGRSASCPTGDIYFFHYGKTKAMIAAKLQIEKMNYLKNSGE